MAKKTLKDATWSAAGWGSPYCPSCGGELQRVTALGTSYPVCPTKGCKGRHIEDAAHYRQSPNLTNWLKELDEAARCVHGNRPNSCPLRHPENEIKSTNSDQIDAVKYQLGVDMGDSDFIVLFCPKHWIGHTPKEGCPKCKLEPKKPEGLWHEWIRVWRESPKLDRFEMVLWSPAIISFEFVSWLMCKCKGHKPHFFIPEFCLRCLRKIK